METIKNRKILFEANDGDSIDFSHANLFIEAGAGAGKTTTMIDKIVQQLEEGIPPERFVIITFTNKSAEDMLSRINARIAKLAKKDIRFADILKNLSKMNISTIHSFCNKLLSENSFYAKLSYSPILLEEEDDSRRQKRIFHEWKKTLKFEDIDKLYESGSENPMYSLEQSYIQLCGAFDNQNIITDHAIDKNEFLKGLSFITNIAESYEGEDSTFYSKAGAAFMDSYLIYKNTIRGLSQDEIYDKFNCDEEARDAAANLVLKCNSNVGLKKDSIKKFGRSRKDELSDLADEIKENIKANKDYLDGFKKIIEAHQDLFDKGISTINKYAMEAWEYFKKHRGSETISNNQLIYETYKMVNDESVRKKIAEQYDVIYVDEFQDTDKCQIDFVTKLALAIDERKKSNGINSMSLFLVGDPKQSIYRFRGADFRSFMGVRNNFENLGSNFKTIFFPDNFRSSNFIIDYVNDTYSARDFVSDGSFKYENMEINKTIPSNLYADPILKLGGVYSVCLGEKANHIDNLANLIKSIKEGGYQIYKDGKFRNVDYKDIMIVTTSKKDISKYVQALSKIGIKVNVSGEVDLSGSSHLFRIIHHLMVYVLDRQPNNKHLAESILKQYYGKDLSYIDEIDDLKMTPYGIMVKLLNDFEISLDSFEKEDEYTFKAISQQIIENLSTKADVDGPSLLDTLDDLLINPAKEQIIVDESADAVRIMNAHKTKGLESKIVIIANSGGFANSSGLVTVGDDAYLNCIKTFPDISDENCRESDEEKLRLEYVAATRAEQVLIFEEKPSDSRGNNLFFRKDNGYEFGEETLRKYHIPGSMLPDLMISDDVDVKQKNKVLVKSNGYEKIDDDCLINPIIETSPSALENQKAWKPGLIYRQHRRPADNVFGTALHRVMELFVLGNEDKEEIINLAIKEADVELPISEKKLYESSLKECLDAIKQLFVKTRILENADAKPEYKFMEMEGNRLINGSIDLLLMKNNEAIIIDYKSDIASFHDKEQFENGLIEAYSPQLNEYQRIMSKLMPNHKISKYIIWVEEKDEGSLAHLLDMNV